MKKIRELASRIEGVYDLVMGEGLKSPADQVIREYPGIYTHHILTSRM